MWHRVDVVLTDISEERITSNFRVEGKIRKFTSEETVTLSCPLLAKIPDDGKRSKPQ
jgi:predicted transcriptional regulator